MSEELYYEFSTDSEMIGERYQLAVSRIKEIKNEKLGMPEYDEYFRFVSGFIEMMDDTLNWSLEGGLEKDSIEELGKRNKALYEDILPENYGSSFGNPEVAVQKLGEEFGKILSSLYFEIRSMIPSAFEHNRFDMVIRAELFLEVYGAFSSACEEGKLPEYETIRQIMYWFYSDYAEEERCIRFAQMVAPESDYARDIIMNSDLTDLRYLYKFGEYITDNELKTAEHLNTLSQEEIDKLATTYTEGYRIGFAMTGKDITIKKTAAIVYELGFERIVKKAVSNFKEIGLKSSIYRANMSVFTMLGSARRSGYTGAVPNKQFDYDHKDDDALYLDGALVTRRLEAMRAAGEKYKKEAKVFGGPAVIETFGEKPFAPVPKKDAVHYSDTQKKLLSDFKIQNSLIMNEYIIGKERSFTIIAFPVPEIGPKFQEIFNEVVKINTLDYKLYQNIQQKIIDALDEAVYVEVKGMNGNRTDMKVMLHELKDKAHETNFENCVADVNIPVGEVFTSPVLKGTNGTLHVSGVYLEGLFFKNLEITFEDGCIKDYNCSNFESDEENKKYISDNILFNHKTLPIGEFAIGTNTTAYRIARDYSIADKLPILIAEKTGPHFAVGDTCYSHEEDNITYNPDGKSIIARDNEISLNRKTDPDKAYFSCHTDITIPYDELGEIRAVKENGEGIVIIQNGEFVLPGTEELNIPIKG
ncbi:Leucyl aminopeptidase (aminopeptidase T) [Butyrivibrio proteoclasticus]|uniref:Leucyl aminopeptidase (Aminopeptidase T) n=1 Tax=Butyrivibrio proteoclasticus TaxID=43305 RepID=A0A1I5T9P7_9FIRM|nr:aminopeptidase [Butyrivibrio proteoclasticus]SFP79769.1 Leucyl aminopeptidase (aminopeptidase T) [Butyrivibrio proteoclasticus]